MTKKKEDDTQVYTSRQDELFKIVKGDDKKYHIIVGKYAVSSKNFNRRSEAELYISQKPYEIIINLCALCVKQSKEYEKEQTEKQSKSNE